MQIKEMAARAGVSESTVRYYESIGVLPEPARQPNGYRDYAQEDVERLRLVAGARQLDLTLDDIGEILALRDRGEAPCRMVLELLRERAEEIDRRIVQLQRLEVELRRLHALGETFPTDDVEGKACVCHLLTAQATGKEARR